MGMKIEMDSKKAIEKLEDLGGKFKELEGEHKIPFSEIFNSPFMSKHTKYSSFDDMLDKSHLLEKYGDFESIDDGEWDAFIQKNTDFSNWMEMKSEASRIWALKQIGLK